MTAMCPVGGAMYYGANYQMCFYVVTEPAQTYSAKQDACSRHGGVLSHIPDANANAFLLPALSGMSQHIFVLGLNDMAQEGVFVTSAGKVQSWINWRMNQPDDWGGVEDCCELFVTDTNLTVNDCKCLFHINLHITALCHMEIDPELPPKGFGGQNDGDRNAFTKLSSTSKGIVGAQLKNITVYSRSMCALLCRQDDNCNFFVFTSADALCSTYASPIIEPTTEGAQSQIGMENVWVRR